jgi:hypothetical protein
VADEPGVPAPPLLHAATPSTRAASAHRVPQPNPQVPLLSRVISMPPVAPCPAECPTDSPSTLTCAANAQMDHHRGGLIWVIPFELGRLLPTRSLQ